MREILLRRAAICAQVTKTSATLAILLCSFGVLQALRHQGQITGVETVTIALVVLLLGIAVVFCRIGHRLCDLIDGVTH
jgi:hypothetical protein